MDDPGKAMPEGAAIAEAVLSMLAERADDATICPSEVARALERPGVPWRSMMDDVRAVAARLVDEDRLSVTQGGQVVDPATARGPIRLRRPY